MTDAENNPEEEKADLEDFKEMSSGIKDLLGNIMDFATDILDGPTVEEDPDEPELLDNFEDWVDVAEEQEPEPPKPKVKVPEVRILGLEFHWDDSDPSNSGMPLFPSDSRWEPDPRSHVAYSLKSIAETLAKGNLKVRARFAWDFEEKGMIQVRTQCNQIDILDVLNASVVDQYPGHDVLGNVAPTIVFFNDSQHSVYRGKYTYVPMKLENVMLEELGVGVYDINWQWQFRMKDEEASEAEGKTVWQEEWYTIRTNNSKTTLKFSAPFQLTKHRVYVSLDVPTHPWTPKSIPDTRSGLPLAIPLWTSAFEIACTWAKGACDKGEAAKLIADRLYASGKFVYNPNPNYTSLESQGSPGYGGLKIKARTGTYVAYFQFEKVIERLRGGYGLGPKVNCFDCALIVSTLANMIGCRLQAGKLQNMADIDASDEDHYLDNRFEIQPIRAIGLEEGGEHIGGVSKKDRAFFTYHTVAWSAPHGEVGVSGEFMDPECRIYDACVEFLIDGEAVSASGWPLGDGQTDGNTYINRLAAPTADGRPRCKPQPITVVDVQISC